MSAPTPTSDPNPNNVQNNVAVSPPVDLSQYLKVYKPPETTATLPSDALSDSDFEPTAAELQAAYASQTRRLESLVNAPLKTQAIKDREEKARASRWPETTIRIKFPDQTIIERSFPSTDKIKSVYQFVRGALITEAQSDKFILYQPPRRDLKVSDPEVKPLSLAELRLAPSSLLLLRFQTEAYNSTTLPPPLLPQILGKAVPLPTSRADPPSPGSPASQSAPRKAGAATGEKKVPKWFKMGQKK